MVVKLVNKPDFTGKRTILMKMSVSIFYTYMLYWESSHNIWINANVIISSIQNPMYTFIIFLCQHNNMTIVCIFPKYARACVYVSDCRSLGNYGNSTLHKGHKFTDIYIIWSFSVLLKRETGPSLKSQHCNCILPRKSIFNLFYLSSIFYILYGPRLCE